MIQVSANKAFYILFAVSGLLFLLLLSLLTKIVPLTLSHALYNCKEAIAGISFSLPHSFPPVFVFMLLAIVLAGFLLLTYQVYKTKVFVSRILKNEVPIPKKARDIISELDITRQVDIVKDNTYSCFCYGLISPRICLSLKLVNSLTKGELKAVLIHENYHLKNRDPLKVLLSQVAVSMFFFVPVLKDFHKYFILSKELAADQLVIKAKLMQDLKTALAKSLGSLTPSLSGIATFANESNLEQRINALTIPNFKTGINISLLKIIISVLVFTSAFATLSLPVYAMGDKEGGHSYFIMSAGEMAGASCFSENTSKLNYSPKY